MPGEKLSFPCSLQRGPESAFGGRNWFQPLGTSLEGLHQLHGASISLNCSGESRPAVGQQHTLGTKVATLHEDFSEVFKPELGKSVGPPV